MAKTSGVSGHQSVAKNLSATGDRWRNAVSGALYMVGNNIMAHSKRLVPVDLGALKGSGYVTLPEGQLNKTVVEVGYGGPAKDYAVVQEVRDDFKHPDGGQAHYLGDAVDAASGAMAQSILVLAKANFERGYGARRASTPTNPYEGGE